MDSLIDPGKLMVSENGLKVIQSFEEELDKEKKYAEWKKSEEKRIREQRALELKRQAVQLEAQKLYKQDKRKSSPNYRPAEAENVLTSRELPSISPSAHLTKGSSPIKQMYFHSGPIEEVSFSSLALNMQPIEEDSEEEKGARGRGPWQLSESIKKKFAKKKRKESPSVFSRYDPKAGIQPLSLKEYKLLPSLPGSHRQIPNSPSETQSKRDLKFESGNLPEKPKPKNEFLQLIAEAKARSSKKAESEKQESVDGDNIPTFSGNLVPKLGKPALNKNKRLGSPLKERSVFFGEEEAAAKPSVDFQDAVKSIFRAATIVESPKDFTSPRTSRYKLRQSKLFSSQLMIKNEPIKPEAILQGAISEVENQCKTNCPDLLEMVDKRLQPFKILKPAQISHNCISEITRLQKLGQLVQKHSLGEVVFKKRLEDEERLREEIVNMRSNAMSILSEADRASNQFNHIGLSIALGSKSRLPVLMLREDLRKLKAIEEPHKALHIGHFKSRLDEASSMKGMMSARTERDKGLSSAFLEKLPTLSPANIKLSERTLPSASASLVKKEKSDSILFKTRPTENSIV